MEPIDQLYDIYELSYQPFWHTWWWYAGLWITTAIIALYLTRCLWKRYTAYRSHIPFDQYIHTYLDNLLKEKIIFSNDYTSASFYGTLTDLLKTYLEKQFDLSTRSKTDQELLYYIQESQLSDELIYDIRSFLERSYMVKFAHSELSDDDARRYIEQLRSIVKKVAWYKKSHIVNK